MPQNPRKENILQSLSFIATMGHSSQEVVTYVGAYYLKAPCIMHQSKIAQ